MRQVAPRPPPPQPPGVAVAQHMEDTRRAEMAAERQREHEAFLREYARITEEAQKQSPAQLAALGIPNQHRDTPLGRILEHPQTHVGPQHPASDIDLTGTL